MSQSLVILAFMVVIVTSANVPQSRIIGGTTAALGQFPYTASLQTTLSAHFCGGAIINNRWILTAAHCTMNRHVDTFMVRVGSSTYNNGGVAHSIAKTIIHPAFNASDRSYDISTVQTMDEIVFNSYTKPIALATTNKESGLAYVTGWGIVGTLPLAQYALYLQFLATTPIDNVECKQLHKVNGLEERIHDYNICSKNVKRKGICTGDNGGPLVIGNELVGIASWATTCASSEPDVYIRVFSFLNWINQNSK